MPILLLPFFHKNIAAWAGFSLLLVVSPSPSLSLPPSPWASSKTKAALETFLDDCGVGSEATPGISLEQAVAGLLHALPGLARPGCLDCDTIADLPEPLRRAVRSYATAATGTAWAYERATAGAGRVAPGAGGGLPGGPTATPNLAARGARRAARAAGPAGTGAASTAAPAVVGTARGRPRPAASEDGDPPARRQRGQSEEPGLSLRPPPWQRPSPQPLPPQPLGQWPLSPTGQTGAAHGDPTSPAEPGPGRAGRGGPQ